MKWIVNTAQGNEIEVEAAKMKSAHSTTTFVDENDETVAVFVGASSVYPT